jgi:hypothetical protein
MNEQIQQQTPQPEKKPSQHMHDTKTTFLVVVTFVFALLSLVSLFFVLRMRNDVMTQPKPQSEQEIIVSEIEPVETNIPDDELNLEKEVFELDKLNLEKIENSYSEETLD